MTFRIRSFLRLRPPDVTEMIIPINCVPSSGGAPDSKREWAMVELQGEIQRRDGDPNSPGYDLGQFSRNDKTGNVLLTIGYHQLEGVEQPLKKPFAILKKSAEGGDGPGSYDVCGFVVLIRQFVRSFGIIHLRAHGRLHTCRFVTKKYLFKQRPYVLFQLDGRPDTTSLTRSLAPRAAPRFARCPGER